MLQRLPSDLFHQAVPPVPQGRYAHFVVLRETESFPVFQTDGNLNVISIQAGVKDQRLLTRILLFKRKQSSPERLLGRELLRRYGISSSERGAAGYCDYNGSDFCKRCPDCILYGYAIGDQGAEKSKVLVDSGFSLTGYDDAHKQFSFNGLYESGTMTREGETRASFGEQDHVIPQVFFPCVETLRDPTEEGFIYVLNNILRTPRYGAQETRTGRVENTVLGVVFADGEIFSNLRLTQTVYDAMAAAGHTSGVLPREDVRTATEDAIGPLLERDNVVVNAIIMGTALAGLLDEVRTITANEAELRALLGRLASQCNEYASIYGPKIKGKGKGKSKQAAGEA